MCKAVSKEYSIPLRFFSLLFCCLLMEFSVCFNQKCKSNRRKVEWIHWKILFQENIHEEYSLWHSINIEANGRKQKKKEKLSPDLCCFYLPDSFDVFSVPFVRKPQYQKLFQAIRSACRRLKSVLHSVHSIILFFCSSFHYLCVFCLDFIRNNGRWMDFSIYFSAMQMENTEK